MLVESRYLDRGGGHGAGGSEARCTSGAVGRCQQGRLLAMGTKLAVAQVTVGSWPHRVQVASCNQCAK